MRAGQGDPEALSVWQGVLLTAPSSENEEEEVMKSVRYLLALTTLAVLVLPASGQERLLAVDTSGSQLLQLDPVSGQSTFIANVQGGGTIGALAYDPTTDTLYASSTSLDELWKIDYKTGLATLVGAYNLAGINPVMHGLEYHPVTGKLYGIDYTSKGLCEIDKNTGQAVLIGTTPLTGFGSIAWDASAGVMFGGDSGTDSLWKIDLGTGAGTLVGPFNAPSAGSLGTGMAWSPTYGLYAVNNAGTDSLWKIDTATGQATLIANLSTSNVISIAFIPEPASLAALAILSGLIRRR